MGCTDQLTVSEGNEHLSNGGVVRVFSPDYPGRIRALDYKMHADRGLMSRVFEQRAGEWVKSQHEDLSGMTVEISSIWKLADAK